MSRLSRGPLATCLGLALALPLAACGSGQDDKAPAPAASAANDTLASAISDAPGMTIVATGLKSTGLANVFDGAAPYTLLAPDDDAFSALGEAGTGLQQPENSAAMAAILRNHILPGFVTMADIDAALKAKNGQPVKMRTLGDSEVTFAREGDALVVSTADGAHAKVDGTARPASNGVLIPIDAVLRKLPAGEAAD